MSSFTYGGNVPPDVVRALEVLLDATQSGDYEEFIALGTEQMKAGISRAMFERVSAQLAPRMTAGYSAAYLTELKNKVYRVHLWKVSFRDGGDEHVMRISLTPAGRVAGAIIN